jgi:hypothetical protein
MQHLIEKIIKLLKAKPPEFFQFKKIYGSTTGLFKGDHIELDFRKDLVQSIIHECLHVIDPDWSETAVMKLERSIIKEITNLQVATILQILSRKIKYTEINQSYLKRE